MPKLLETRASKFDSYTKVLLFVDANVFLDFYRFPGKSAKRTLEAVNRHKKSLITTEQIWMEFLKNRQNVINNSLEAMQTKFPCLPAIAQDIEGTHQWQDHTQKMTKMLDKLRTHIESMLREPSQNDPIYNLI